MSATRRILYWEMSAAVYEQFRELNELLQACMEDSDEFAALLQPEAAPDPLSPASNEIQNRVLGSGSPPIPLFSTNPVGIFSVASVVLTGMAGSSIGSASPTSS